MSQTISEITTGLIRTFHDEEKTKLKEEYFIHINKKEGIYKSYWDKWAIIFRSKLCK
jgi:hypothetical protein